MAFSLDDLVTRLGEIADRHNSGELRDLEADFRISIRGSTPEMQQAWISTRYDSALDAAREEWGNGWPLLSVSQQRNAVAAEAMKSMAMLKEEDLADPAMAGAMAELTVRVLDFKGE